MAAPAIVGELVERFNAHRETYLSSQYNGAQLREEFLNPFFEALGWDVYNRQGYADAYKEVIHEDAIKIGGRTKPPDYCFRAGGGQRSFFVEAKKPSVDIGEAAGPAYQLRRYAWSAKLPVSILSDFEHFAVYDCRIRPERTDKATAARIIFRHYTEYLECWDELVGLFSPQNIRRGSLERLVASKKIKKGSAEVDAAFLDEIESWRSELARNIALRNEGLSSRDLNFAVQRTVDRIVFLRICEDRGIEPYGTLESLRNAANIYRRLAELFQRADDRYNSGLFHFTPEKGRTEPPDELTLSLTIDDRPLKEIIQALYFPESPYEFSVFPIEILGQVYEQFLGKVIRLTKGHQAKVEEKPEVRKAGGVYYTPGYIVDYIVQHTVGRLLEGGRRKAEGGEERAEGEGRKAESKRALTPAQASKLRILDPACGSGSFLIGAYQYLLTWHRDWYVTDGPEKHARGRNPKLYLGPPDDWRLTTAEKKRILLGNVYGVDIDPQAVEVTKLSLLLKVLEGESKETVNNQLRLLHERALPDLGANIKCGNSLIGPDFYDGQQMSLFDEEERYRINVFDWSSKKDGFGEIMAAGGFDAVIGNPPYLFITEVPKRMRRYYQQQYHGVSYRFDLYGAFIEKSLLSLIGKGSRLGVIVPHTLLSNDSFRALRAVIAHGAAITRVVDLGPGVFQNAKNETMLLFLEKRQPSAQSKVEVIRSSPKVFPEVLERFVVKQRGWAADDGSPWLVHVLGDKLALVHRLAQMSQRLGDYCTANQGLRTGDNEKYISHKCRGKAWKPAAGGKDVPRYGVIRKGRFVRYEPNLLDAPRRPEIFDTAEKIVVQEVRNISLPRRIIATLDQEQTYCLQSTNVVNTRQDCPFDVRYLLGVLNSTLINFYFRCRFPGNNHIPSNQLLDVPLPGSPQKSPQGRITELVEMMLSLHERLALARTAHQKTVLDRQIDATDRQIDQLVYELYGLTDEEIAIVEQSG